MVQDVLADVRSLQGDPEEAAMSPDESEAKAPDLDAPAEMASSRDAPVAKVMALDESEGKVLKQDDSGARALCRGVAELGESRPGVPRVPGEQRMRHGVPAKELRVDEEYSGYLEPGEE